MNEELLAVLWLLTLATLISIIYMVRSGSHRFVSRSGYQLSEVTDTGELLQDPEKRDSDLEEILAQRTRERDRQNQLMHIVNIAAELLLKAGKTEFFTAMTKGMELIAHFLGIQRVSIWSNQRKEDGRLYYHLVCEWSAAGLPELDSTRDFAYQEFIPEWEELFLRGESINGPIDDLPIARATLLPVYDIKSMLVMPVFLYDELWGFVSFDDYLAERVFPEGEFNILSSWGMLAVGGIRRYEILMDLERALEAAQEASQAKTTFLANMSHEIRTPMNSIMGFAELALDKVIVPQVREYLVKIIDSTTWLLHIINDILDISKIESGKIELESVPFDLYGIFTRCQSVIYPNVVEKGLDLRVYAEPTTGRQLLGDPVRLYQALMNLLTNAVKFTDFGTVKLSSTILSSQDTTLRIYFEVKDSGIGMSAEQVERIYDPFTQGDSSTTRNFGGTGLGLAITKNLVELMGGNLNVESSPGHGSTFSFVVSFDTIAAHEEQPVYAEITSVERPTFSGDVLVCEDNPMNQQVICEHLMRLGLSTVVAENGQIGCTMVEERLAKGTKPFDLIFMDIFMPVMDGVEAASRISSLRLKTPIVAMTANVMIGELENYKNSGMIDYIGKPFTSQELWRCLLRHLTPMGFTAVSQQDQQIADSAFLDHLRLRFIKDNRRRYGEITNAITAGDYRLAHRLTHSLKTNAGMIGETALQEAAASIEEVLAKESINPEKWQMELLGVELTEVFLKLQPLLDTANNNDEPEYTDLTTILALIARLETMLDNINPECIELLGEIRRIAGTEELIRQIEDYEFETAAYTLSGIKGRLIQDYGRE